MIIAAIFLAATVAYFLTGNIAHDTVGAVRAHDSLVFAERAQVIPSTLALCMGALLFWLCATFFMGKIYCSTVCPVGTLSDAFMRLRREIGKLFPKGFSLPGGGRRRYLGALRFRWKEAKRWRYHIMALYYICLVIGIMAVPFVLEPWNMVRNAAALFDPDAVGATWTVLGVGLVVGFVLGCVLLAVVIVWGFLAGRDFCNTVCPIGQTMALMDRYALLHIEFDPDRCISCMQCEEVCRSSCIRVKDRVVDNSRCVRCLDCIAKCPANAIRLQAGRNKAATPLAMRSE